jgi:peptidoglycan/LPS O-acetylase OafA/YrhL
MGERRLPPFTEVAMASLALIVAGGIYLSAHLPRHVPLTPAFILLALSTLLMAGNLASLARVRQFDWPRFFQVGKWSLLAYLVISGLIEYTFLQNHIKGGSLIVLTLSLAVFTIHVPALVGFTVARYHEPDEAMIFGDGRVSTEAPDLSGANP